MKKITKILGVGAFMLGIAFTFNTETAFALESAPPACKEECDPSTIKMCGLIYSDYTLKCFYKKSKEVISPA